VVVMARAKSSIQSSIAEVAKKGDRRQTLLAIRDRLAQETDDARWAQHKRECRCTCGIGDGRVLVALVKELRAVEAELAGLPSDEKVSKLDRIADELAERRAKRRSAAAG